MLHFTRITTPGKNFNLIASGALAFKIHNKILREEEFRDGTSITRDKMLTESASGTTATTDNIFFVIISDLDKINTESLCNMIARERENGGYAVCEVIPMLYNEISFKALNLLRQSFDEVLELGKFSIGSSKMLINAEHQNCVISDYSVSMARIIYNSCVTRKKNATSVQEKEKIVYAA